MRLDKQASMHLYRIAQEAITNAIKHGQAKTIEVRAVMEEEHFELTIRDDGCGFTQPHPEGMGMSIMKYRAALISAELSVYSALGCGCTVRCCLHYQAYPTRGS